MPWGLGYASKKMSSAATTACPCGSGESFEACCEPRLSGAKPAETPEALMRSRYTAFTKGDGGYLIATQAPALSRGSADSMVDSFSKRTWVGLTVREAKGDQVAFEARFLEHGVLFVLSERSRFTEVGGRWRYESGEHQLRREELGRNERCPCGSGKKFKACHGA